jgi:hypothetical protein
MTMAPAGFLLDWRKNVSDLTHADRACFRRNCHPALKCCHPEKGEKPSEGPYQPLNAAMQQPRSTTAPNSSSRFHFPLHHFSQSLVDASLIPAPVFLEPRQNIGIKPQCDRFLQRTI